MRKMSQLVNEKHFMKGIPTILSCLIPILILLVGCSGGESPKEATKSASSPKTQIPVKKSEPTKVQPTLAKAPVPTSAVSAPVISSTPKNLFEILVKEMELKKAGKPESEITALASAKAEALAKAVPTSLCPEIDVLSFDYERVGKEEFEIRLVVRANKQLNVDAVFFSRCMPSEEYKAEIPDQPNFRKAGYCLYTLKPIPPLKDWKPGEIQPIWKRVSTKALPYFMILSLRSSSDQKVIGREVNFGWFAEVDNPTPAINKIDGTTDLAGLVEIMRIYGNASKVNSAISDALAKRIETIVAKEPKLPFCPEIDLVGFIFTQTDPGTFTASILCRAKQQVEKDYNIYLRGDVKPEDRQKVSALSKDESKDFSEWGIVPNVPMSQWKTGNYYLAQRTVKTEAVPYRMKVSIEKRDVKGVSVLGKPVVLGWVTDTSKAKIQPVD